MKECILFVHSSDEMYGADKILMELVVNIKEQYHPIVIVPSDIKATYLSDALRSKGVNVRKIPLGILRRKYFTFIGILKFFLNTLYSLAILISIINKNDVRIIHSNTLAVFSGALAASICRKPHVWHVHENILYPKIFWKFTSLISQLLSDKVICVSNPTKEHLLKGISIHTKKVSVIHNGISEKELQQCSSSRESTRREWNIEKSEVLIGMIGRINHFKGQDHFIEVARRLVSNNPGLRFVMVGGCVPGKEEDLSKIKMLRKKYNLENHIRIEDFRNGISDVYNALDIFVLPSTLPDPFPTVILEAMAMKKPIVANALGGSTEMIIHGETGFLVPADQPQQMAEYIEGLAIDPDLRNSMGTKAQERFTYCFSLERFIDQWEAVYKELLDSSK